MANIEECGSQVKTIASPDDELQDGQKVFVFLGAAHQNGWCINMARVLAQDGHKCVVYDPIQLMLKYMMRINVRHANPQLFLKKDTISLANCLKTGLFETIKRWKDEPDYFVISQKGIFIGNDTDIPTIYYHHEICLPINVDNPSAICISFPEGYSQMELFHSREWYKCPVKHQLVPPVAESLLDPNRKKTIKGLSYIGRTDDNDRVMMPQHRDYTDSDLLTIIRDEVNFMNSHPEVFNGFFGDVAFPQYKQILEMCEAVVIVVPHNFYVSRRIFEAMATRTLCVLKVENPRARAYYKALGLVNGENCLMYETQEQLLQAAKAFREPDHFISSEILDNAYEYVMENHTYTVRLKQFYQILDEIEHPIEEAVQPVYPQPGIVTYDGGKTWKEVGP